MHTTDFIAAVTGHRDAPDHRVSPDHELRALAAAQAIVDELTPRIGVNTTSPVHAAFFVHAAEHAQDRAAHAQLIAADLAQRTLAHELPVEALDALLPLSLHPAGYIDGTRPLPADPRSVPTGRPTFKDTAEFLQNTLGIEYFEASARMKTVARLFPQTDANGITRPPQFARLAAELATGNASLKNVGAAAKRLAKLRPHINAQPDPEALSRDLEARVAESVSRDPRGTKELMDELRNTLERRTPVPTQEIVDSRIGLFYRGHRSGTAEFLLRTRAADAELLLSLCAQTDNPRTKAGDRTRLPEQPAALDTLSGQGAGTGTVFPDFLLAPGIDTGQPLHTLEELEALTLHDSPVENTDSYTALNAPGAGVDGLTRPQRHLQGLLNLLRANGRPGSGKKATGLPSPQLLIIAQLEDLEARSTGTGRTAHGQRLTPAELRQELCHAGAIPMIMNGPSRILDLGRSERYFPEYLRQAILARDGGCIVPGCTVPPEHCEIHHLVPWEAGGRTGIRDGTPACSNHHHAFHTGQIRAELNDEGLPAVILPRFMDPDQQPRRNHHGGPPPYLATPALF
ncbi:HNH endonuclease signature motif containing protein [Paeniglutamicibacter cryotolerans]|uniref:HNH nuclease domain-containing protein n=1 Tax=Paeniglutamicibacter cryotolerans TaxID=670079 RepID=A0A839QI36_9MICC|nr:HNH endonuclease signature motif containing protein [Paeniglutamicibacter cryotolerans]MBB2996058.1 hypothetical protein [Paeniglutamicibacter cryotolerans]